MDVLGVNIKSNGLDKWWTIFKIDILVVNLTADNGPSVFK